MNTPPAGLRGEINLVTRLKTGYQLWLAIIPHIPKLHRYTFGGKIDALFLEALEILFRAQYAAISTKLQYILAGIGKIDLLKFFLQIGWENKLVDTKKYAALSSELQEIGRMLGGWKRRIESKTPR